MDDDIKIEGIKKMLNITFDLDSPRYLSTKIDKNIKPFPGGDTIYYIFLSKGPDIYEHVYRCRCSKRHKQKFAFGNFSTIEEVEKNSRDVYLLVSGLKLPTNIDPEEKFAIKKWLTRGVFIFYIYDKKRFGQSIIVSSETKAYIVSSNNHTIGENDSCFLDVNFCFTAMMIDYYEINSGIHDKNAQISFMQDSNYRKAVYDKMKEVFCSFINTNGRSINSSELTAENIVKKVLEILEEY